MPLTDAELTTLHLRISRGQEEAAVLEQLETLDPNFVLKGWPLLNHAALHGRIAIVRRLLKRKANPDSRGDNQFTALMDAISNKHVEVVKALLAAGADVQPVNRFGSTALERALYWGGGIEICRLLADHGAELPADIFDKAFPFEPAVQAFVDDMARRGRISATITRPGGRVRKEGVIKPSLATAKWKDLHTEFWTALVPNQGDAPTRQGEVIRITGKVARELLDNGGANWGASWLPMLDRLERILLDGSLTLAETAVVSTAVQTVRMDSGRLRAPAEALSRLSDAAVHYVLARPELIPFGADKTTVKKQPTSRKVTLQKKAPSPNW